MLLLVADVDPYETLHARIVTGELSPGERLVEEELAEQLGLSRGAIRTALLRLEHARVVIRERNRGARVRRISAQEAVEILEARPGPRRPSTARSRRGAGYRRGPWSRPWPWPAPGKSAYSECPFACPGESAGGVY